MNEEDVGFPVAGDILGTRGIVNKVELDVQDDEQMVVEKCSGSFFLSHHFHYD